MPRFIHAADIHLDSPLRGLEDYPGAPVERIRAATRGALTKLVDLCLVERIDFLVIAGDVFDTDGRDFNTALFAAHQLRRLEPAGIPVFLIFGNHDSYQEMSRRAPWPSNVTVFDHKKPETKRLPELQVALHGRSFPKREVADNWVPDYPDSVPDWFNIGVLHTNANGSPNHDSYAPCTVSELVAKGYGYWALGHVHDYQVLNEQPPVVYSGNTQGRHAREVGTKGCVLVTVTGNEVTQLEFRETDVLRWQQLVVPLEADDGCDEMLDRVRAELRQLVAGSAGHFAAVRLEITGRCRAHRALVRDDDRLQAIADLRGLAGEFADELWVEKIRFRTQSPIDVEALRQGQDLVGELLREITAIAADPQRLAELADELKPLAAKVAGDLKDESGGEGLDFQNPDQLAAWLREAETLLVHRLVEAEA